MSHVRGQGAAHACFLLVISGQFCRSSSHDSPSSTLPWLPKSEAGRQTGIVKRRSDTKDFSA